MIWKYFGHDFYYVGNIEMDWHIRIKNKGANVEYHVLITISLHLGSNLSLAQGINCNPRGIDWPSGDMVVGDPMGKNMEVASGDYYTIAIANYKGKKYHLYEVSSSYFYTRRKVYWPTLAKRTKYFVVS